MDYFLCKDIAAGRVSGDAFVSSTEAVLRSLNLITEDGKLPEGLNQESLFAEHASQPRNRNLANVFYKAGFIETFAHKHYGQHHVHTDGKDSECVPANFEA